MEAEGILVHGLTRLSTASAHQHENHKRSSSPYASDDDESTSKRPRLEETDVDMAETSSRESRWSQYRDFSNLSTITEASETQNNPDDAFEGLHVSANQVSDLEEHIDKLAMELEEWSLVNLKEWRRKKAVEQVMNNKEGSPQRTINPLKAARQRQRAAKRNLMRALIHHDGNNAEPMLET